MIWSLCRGDSKNSHKGIQTLKTQYTDNNNKLMSQAGIEPTVSLAW